MTHYPSPRELAAAGWRNPLHGPHSVYVITHRSGMQYVGMTRKTLRARWSGHVSASRRGRTKIAEAIRSDGPDAFQIEVVHRVNGEYPARALESAEILTRATVWPFGFNQVYRGMPKAIGPHRQRSL